MDLHPTRREEGGGEREIGGMNTRVLEMVVPSHPSPTLLGMMIPSPVMAVLWPYSTPFLKVRKVGVPPWFRSAGRPPTEKASVSWPEGVERF